MSEKNLVVCDKELRYADGLGKNISTRSEFALRVYICTNLASVMRLRKERDIHILIVDEAFSYEERAEMKAEQTFVLTKEVCQDLGEKEKEIYKFQSADRILAIVFETYCERSGNSILKTIKKQKRKLIAVYSPIHRVGKTSFAISLGKELAKMGKTLYLNLEEYADVGERFVKAEGRNLADLLYYMRQESNDAALRVSTMAQQMENLDYIPPFLLSADLKQVSLEEWKNLLQLILEETMYETVILDLGESLQGLTEILQFCDTIYMPVLEDEISQCKVQRFHEGLQQMQLEGLEDKIQEFTAADNMETYARKLIREET